MANFFIVAIIILIAAFIDFKTMKEVKHTRYTVFFTISICVSLALAAFHCLGFHLDDLHF